MHFSFVTFYGRDSLINSACNHYHSALLSTILHQPQPQTAGHRNILKNTCSARRYQPVDGSTHGRSFITHFGCGATASTQRVGRDIRG